MVKKFLNGVERVIVFTKYDIFDLVFDGMRWCHSQRINTSDIGDCNAMSTPVKAIFSSSFVYLAKASRSRLNLTYGIPTLHFHVVIS